MHPRPPTTADTQFRASARPHITQLRSLFIGGERLLGRGRRRRRSALPPHVVRTWREEGERRSRRWLPAVAHDSHGNHVARDGRSRGSCMHRANAEERRHDSLRNQHPFQHNSPEMLSINFESTFMEGIHGSEENRSRRIDVLYYIIVFYITTVCE